jgi:Predicted glutamine amidotransferase involved in pyridoxine biosynthesis
VSGSKKRSITIGVLGFQGDIEENVAAAEQAIKDLDIAGTVKVVRNPEELRKS